MPKPYVKPRTSASKIRDSQLSARKIKAQQEASKKAVKETLGSKPFSQLIHEQEYQAAEYLVNQKVNYYTFTTDMQDRMLDLVKPCLENQLADRQQVKELQLYHNKLSKRLQYMEACFNQQKGRNKVFDQINERITVAEQWQRQNQTNNDGSLRRLQE